MNRQVASDGVFTGIVEELGKVIEQSRSKLRIEATKVLDSTQIGSSIAVNGCCLTVIALDKTSWSTELSEETLNRTNLGQLRVGDLVNLERPIAIGERLGGHLVLGHVDLVGEIACPAPNLVVRVDQDSMHLIVEKGSITVDGVSLTVFNLTNDTFSVALIPHTCQVTTLGVRKIGDRVNIEIDMVAKHIARLAEPNIRSRKFWRR